MKLKDPIELGESKCEEWANENVQGYYFKCECGNVCKLEDGETLSSDPYAIPVCPICAEKFYSDSGGNDVRFTKKDK